MKAPKLVENNDMIANKLYSIFREGGRVKFEKEQIFIVPWSGTRTGGDRCKGALF